MSAKRVKRIFQIVLSVLTRQKAAGVERVPEPPYIQAINHIGFFDVVFTYAIFGDERMVGWAAEKYEKHLIFGPLLRGGGAIFIQRGKVDRSALDAAVEALRSGRSFGMAPEGTRSKDGALARAKTGIAYLAGASGAPVVPTALTGTEDIFGPLLRLRRPSLVVRVGEPFHLPPLPEQGRNAALRANTDEVMCRIAAMLPSSYRGYYADYPRTQQLLASGYGDNPIEANAPPAF